MLTVRVVTRFSGQATSRLKVGVLKIRVGTRFSSPNASRLKFRWLPDFRARIYPTQNSGGYPIFEPEHPAQNSGGYLIFGPGHIPVESRVALNLGGYPIFEPKCILLEIQVATQFLSQNASCSKFGWVPVFYPWY